MVENDEDKNFEHVNDSLLKEKLGIGNESIEYVKKSEIFLREDENSPASSLIKNMNRRSSGISSLLIVPKKKSGCCVISLENTYKRIFDFIMVLSVAYSCFFSIFYVAFGDPSSMVEIAIMITVEGFFVIDIILNFLQEFKDPTTLEIVRNYGPIAKNYLSSYFLFDFIAIIPLQILGSNYYAFKLFRLVRLSKLLSFVDSTRFSEVLGSCFKGSTKDEQVEAQYFVFYKDK